MLLITIKSIVFLVYLNFILIIDILKNTLFNQFVSLINPNFTA